MAPSLPGTGPAVLGLLLIGWPSCYPTAREMSDRWVPQTEALSAAAVHQVSDSSLGGRLPLMTLAVASLGSLQNSCCCWMSTQEV